MPGMRYSRFIMTNNKDQGIREGIIKKAKGISLVVSLLRVDEYMGIWVNECMSGWVDE